MPRQYVAAVALYSAIAASPYAFLAGSGSPLHSALLLLVPPTLAATSVALYLQATDGRRPSHGAGAIIALAAFVVTSLLYYGLVEQSLGRTLNLTWLTLLFYGWFPALLGAAGARLLSRVGQSR